MIPRTSVCSCGLPHTVSALRRWERSIQPALDRKCFKMLPVSGKGKANPTRHLYSVLPATCHFHLILGQVPGSLLDVDAVAWNPFLETDCVIELHDTRPASTRLCARTSTQPRGGSRSAGSDYSDFSSELHVRIESHRNPREKEAPPHLTAKQKRTQAPWGKALTEPPYSIALTVRVECLLLGPEHRPYLVNV